MRSNPPFWMVMRMCVDYASMAFYTSSLMT